MRALALLLTSLTILCFPAHANEQGPNQDQRVGEGMMLMLKGEKQRAWEVLFPEAKAGNVVAMFHLGTMMLKSPEYPDNLERAEKFFSAAAARGHEGSKALLAQVRQSLEAKKQGLPPGIAGASLLPTKEELAEAAARAEKYKQEVIRFTGLSPQIAPKVEVKAFLSDSSAAIEEMYEIAQGVKNKFGDSIKIEFIVVIDPGTWSPDKSQAPSISKVPPVGFQPDFGGRMAAQYGVRQTPALVVTPANGRPKVISNPQSLLSEISALL